MRTLPQPSIAVWCWSPCARSPPGPELSSETSARNWTAGGAAGCGWQTASPGSTSSHTAPRCSLWTDKEAECLSQCVVWSELMSTPPRSLQNHCTSKDTKISNRLPKQRRNSLKSSGWEEKIPVILFQYNLNNKLIMFSSWMKEVWESTLGAFNTKRNCFSWKAGRKTVTLWWVVIIASNNPSLKIVLKSQRSQKIFFCVISQILWEKQYQVI